MPTQKLWVKGLKREDEERVAERLREMDGVFFAVLDGPAGSAEVDFEDDRASVDEIRAALHELGYETGLAG